MYLKILGFFRSFAKRAKWLLFLPMLLYTTPSLAFTCPTGGGPLDEMCAEVAGLDFTPIVTIIGIIATALIVVYLAFLAWRFIRRALSSG